MHARSPPATPKCLLRSSPPVTSRSRVWYRVLLCVNIVRLKNALGDASELSRRALKLESVLLGELLAEEYPEDDEKPPSSAITVPVDFSTLAVVSDEEHESAVGLYLARIAASGLADFLVHAARNADDNEQAIRSLLPNLLERALEYLPSERWTILGRAPDGLRLVRRRGDAALTSSPFHLLENPTRRPQLHGHTRARLGRSRERGRQGRLSRHQAGHDPDAALGSIVAMLQNAQVSQTVIDTFQPGPRTAVRKRDLVAVTAVPLLHKEARILSLLRRIPDAYGFESLDAYYADFSARYEPVDGVPEMTWHDDDNGGETFAELRFCDDGDERVRRLWPASLLRPRRRHRDPRFDERRQGGGYVDRSGGRSAGLPRQARHRHEPGWTRRWDLGQG